MFVKLFQLVADIYALNDSDGTFSGILFDTFLNVLDDIVGGVVA